MKKIFLGLITCCLLLTALAAFSTNVAAQSKKDLKRAKNLVTEGDKLFNRRNYEGAVGKYQEAIKIVPNYPYAHYWKGNAHNYLGQFKEALVELDIAQNQGYTPLLDIYRIRWYANYQTKNYESALADLRQGLELEPTNLLMKAGLGDVNFARKSYSEAVAAYKDVVDKIPNNGNTYYNISFAYYILGQPDNQRAAAQKAIDNGTQNLAEAYILIGDANTKTRRLAEAAVAYEKSLNIRQDIYAVYHNLSDIYRNQNRFADAIEITRKGLRQFPRDSGLYVDLSWYYSLSDMPEEAIGAAQRAIAFEPGQYMAHTNLCRGFNDNKEYEKAIAACNDALRLKPNDGETNFYLGRAYSFLGKSDLSAKYYKNSLEGLVEYTKNFPDNPDGFYLLGNAYFANGLRNKAIEAYLKSLELSPRFTKARYNLGYMYVLNGDTASAQVQYNALVDLDKELAAELKAAIAKAGKP